MSRRYRTHYGYVMSFDELLPFMPAAVAAQLQEYINSDQLNSACVLYNATRPEVSFHGMPACRLPEALRVFSLGDRDIYDVEMAHGDVFVEFDVSELYLVVPTPAQQLLYARCEMSPTLCSWVTCE